MPIRADHVTTEDALSINSSNIQIEAANTIMSDTNTNSTQNMNSSVTLKSSQIPTKINPLKDKSNEKMLRFDGGEQQIIVACRLRPLTEEEIIEGSTLIGHKIADDNMIVLMDPAEDQDDVLRANRSRERQFIFDMVFDPRTTQQDIYEKTTKVLLSGVLDGYNATVFSYGATGAGKTYTMLGTEEEPGIMFRTLHDLFIEISKHEDKTYQVSMSYLEIYNELIRDLLSPSSGFLELREDAKGGVQVAGISELVAETPQEVMYMLHKGNNERSQEPTKANKTSSRSHAVLQVNIKQKKKGKSNSKSEKVSLGKLYMIDLAGSERAAHTQNTGKRMVEGAHINRSLLALGNCINALSEKGSTKYVNYRDSKLTRILKDSLGGNSKTVMIAHVSPASIHFEESRNTLVYADRAKYIRTKLRRNVIDVSFHISQYQTIIQELATEIASLKEQRNDLESRISHFDPRLALTTDDKNKLEEALKLRESLLQSFKHQIGLRKALLELDNAIMDINIEADRNAKFLETSQVQSQSVTNVREEMKVVEAEREELEIKRKAAGKELETTKIRTKRLRDQASKKLNSTEQKEILTLLVKNFEFEIRNIEMQAELFKRDFKLREQDMVILRLEQHRSLCDTLIYQQRQLINDNGLQIPQDLNELYHLYARDVNEGQLMKDLTRADLKISNEENKRLQPDPNLSGSLITQNNLNSSFLSQIQEEYAEAKSGQASGKPEIENAGSSGATSVLPFTSYESSTKVFQTLNNKLTASNVNNSIINNGNQSQSKNVKKGPSSNYQSNYISNNGNIMIGPPQLAFNYAKDKNNLSMLSSSTVDSKDMEIIVDTASNRNLISTQQPYRNNKHVSMVPPGQVDRGIQQGKMNSGSYVSIGGGASDTNIAKRQTQGIAAIAAQRKAFQHHRELMQELGQNEKQQELTASRLARHDLEALNELLEKKNSVLTDNSVSVKAKKQVKIRDIVQYKLPDEELKDEAQFYNNNSNKYNLTNLNSNKQTHQNVRTSSVSPVLIKRSDDVVYKYAKSKQSNNVKRSKSNNPPAIKQSSNVKYQTSSSKLPPPSIPSSYTSNKALNMSISGISVLRN